MSFAWSRNILLMPTSQQDGLVGQTEGQTKQETLGLTSLFYPVFHETDRNSLTLRLLLFCLIWMKSASERNFLK